LTLEDTLDVAWALLEAKERLRFREAKDKRKLRFARSVGR